MRKFFGWAVLNAVLIGWSGISYAEESDAPSCNDGDVTYDSSLADSTVYKSCQNDSASVWAVAAITRYSSVASTSTSRSAIVSRTSPAARRAVEQLRRRDRRQHGLRCR